MSEAETIRSVIARLIDHADETQTRLIHELFHQAGYLWRCGNPSCSAYNHRGLRYCEGCGWGSEGKPVGDLHPCMYTERRWAALRHALLKHYADAPPMPDAVVFDYWGGPGWRGAKVTEMYGGMTEEVTGGFCDRDRFEDIAAALDSLTKWSKPIYGEHIRVVLAS
ncbi:hypothetical protein [Streptomyces lavenduligriseus]|uniref:RanBP2-type domain-containing protein n=1 Tax=Streptomyces lavenduligriseus TaxID=67315 RepID=A0ABT0P5Z4_9ACTN|nr:hypothetical protein [Streptomyces lavenduligriseus]MCL3998976.1 hypothetical protein [Streptomyces lavenduligriseus]